MYEHSLSVSVQTILQSVNSMVHGLTQVKTEIGQINKLGGLPPNDQFLPVMQVCLAIKPVRSSPDLHSVVCRRSGGKRGRS